MLVVLFVVGCSSDKSADSPDSDGSLTDSQESSQEETDVPGIALREDGWLRGDLHIHTTYSDGFDDVPTTIALAEYFDDPVFTESHPEYTGNGLDFISLTDHRTVLQQGDPQYISDLVLVGGEEFGSSGHAGIHGVHEFIDHDPDGDGVSLDDYLLAIIDTHQQGGTFSPNHPFLQNIPWPWMTSDFDGIEIWNSGWALMAPEMTQEKLEAWEASHGTASPLYWRAIQTQGQLASMQALTWYEALLSRGQHQAVIGGSDRHAVLAPGFPTTWIQADAATEGDIIAGLHSRHSFVSRTPVSAQVLVEIDLDDQSRSMGDAVTIPATGAQVQIRVRVGRAEGGLLWVLAGSAVADDTAILTADLGSRIVEEPITSDDFQTGLELAVMPGDWFYPVVLEPLIQPGLTDTEAEQVRTLATTVAGTDGEDFIGLVSIFGELADTEVLFDGSNCDADDWMPAMLQCLPPDQEGLGSFFVPDRFDRALNVYVEDGLVTDWCMGAVGSATRFVSSEEAGR